MQIFLSPEKKKRVSTYICRNCLSWSDFSHYQKWQRSLARVHLPRLVYTPVYRSELAAVPTSVPSCLHSAQHQSPGQACWFVVHNHYDLTQNHQPNY